MKEISVQNVDISGTAMRAALFLALLQCFLFFKVIILKWFYKFKFVVSIYSEAYNQLLSCVTKISVFVDMKNSRGYECQC